MNWLLKTLSLFEYIIPSSWTNYFRKNRPVYGGILDAPGIISGQNNIYYAAANETSIRAQASKAHTAGGGIVLIPEGTITITSALTLYANVIYKGAGTSSDMNTHMLSGGTIIDGVNGSFNGFEYNPNDLSSPTSTSIVLTEIHGAGIFDLGVTRCAYGIKAGALYNGGINHFDLDRITATLCSQWGVWLENCHNQKIGTITCYNNQVGNFAKGASGTTWWNYGNDTVNDIIAQSASGVGNTVTRGVCFFARGSSSLNDTFVEHVTSIGTNTSYNVSATTTTSSPNLGVPECSKFAVGVPVIFATNGSGFSGGKVYIVQSVSAASGPGTITISDRMGGTLAVAASGAGTAQMYVKGGAAIEFAAWDVGSNLTYPKLVWSDTETPGCVDLYLQHIGGGDFSMGITSPSNATQLNAFTARTCDATTRVTFSRQIAVFDSDVGNIQVYGIKPVAFVTQNFEGYVYNPTNLGMELRLSKFRTNGEFYYKDSTGVYNPIQVGAQLALNPGQQADGVTLTGSTGQAVTFTSNGGALTLPAIFTDIVGVMLWISNPSASTLTVNTSSSQTIDNNSGVTSFTIAANSTALVVAHNLAGTFYWAKYK